MSERAIIISTYALCGFANFSSVGIQIGGMSAIAPSRKSDLAKLGLKAIEILLDMENKNYKFQSYLAKPKIVERGTVHTLKKNWLLDVILLINM